MMNQEMEQAQATQVAENDFDRLDTLPVPFQAHSLFTRSPMQILNDEIPDEDFAPMLESKGPANSNKVKAIPYSSTPKSIQLENEKQAEEYEYLEAGVAREDQEGEAENGPLIVSVQAQGIQALPADFASHHHNLRVLDLRNNKLLAFPVGLANMEQLLALRLDNNEIRLIPPTISALTKLEKLTLSNNLISALEPNVGRLPILKSLALDNNRLEDWPESICAGLPVLRLLHLQGNPSIPGIPYKFAQLTQLTEFGLDWFLYLDPSGTAVVKGPNGAKFIEETKQACKYFELRTLAANASKQRESQSVSAKDSCSFVEFMSWFAGLDGKGLLNYVYSKGRNPLHLAAIWGHDTIVREILAADFDLNTQDEEGSTALSLALRCNKLSLAKDLLADRRIDVGIACDKYGTPLHLAIIKGLYEIADLISEKEGLVPNAKDTNGNNVFHYLMAKFSSSPKVTAKICRNLLDRFECQVNAQNGAKMTPLHCAAKKNQVEAIKFAIDYNKHPSSDKHNRFDFNAKGGKYDFSVLHYIVIYTDIETTQFALQNSDMDVLVTDYCGRTVRDLVKNTAVGRLLYKHERSRIRQDLVQRAEMPVRQQSTFKYFKGGANNGHAPMKIAYKKDMKLFSASCSPRGDSPSMVEESTNTPAHFCLEPTHDGPFVCNSSDATPKQYHPGHEEEESFGEKAREAKRARPVAMQRISVRVIAEPLAQRIRAVDVKPLSTIAGTKVSNMSLDTGAKRLAQKQGDCEDDGNVSDTESKCSSVSARPMVYVTKERRGNNTMAQHCRLSLQKQLLLSREEMMLVNNKFTRLYGRLMSKSTKRYVQYKLLYHIFSEYVPDSEDMLVLMCEKMHRSNPLLADIVHLLGQIGSSRLVQALENMMTPGKALAMEILNTGTGFGKYRVPLKGVPRMRQKARMKPNRTTISSSAANTARNSMRASMAPRPCALHLLKVPDCPDVTHLAHSVQFVPIKKALNYFDETNS